MAWSKITWHGLKKLGMSKNNVAWAQTMWHGLTSYSMSSIKHVMAWAETAWAETVWHGPKNLAWAEKTWHGLKIMWHGLNKN